MSRKITTKGKWLIVIAVLVCCGVLSSAYKQWQHKEPEKSSSISSGGEIKVGDTELALWRNVSSGKDGSFILVVCDKQLETSLAFASGPYGDRVNKDEFQWSIKTQRDTLYEKSHVVPKNSIFHVNQFDRITTLLTLEDKALVHGLVDMYSSDDKEKQTLAEHLFDALIQYGYQKAFSADKKDNEIDSLAPNP